MTFPTHTPMVASKKLPAEVVETVAGLINARVSDVNIAAQMGWSIGGTRRVVRWVHQQRRGQMVLRRPGGSDALMQAARAAEWGAYYKRIGVEHDIDGYRFLRDRKAIPAAEAAAMVRQSAQVAA